MIIAKTISHSTKYKPHYITTSIEGHILIKPMNGFSQMFSFKYPCLQADYRVFCTHWVHRGIM